MSCVYFLDATISNITKPSPTQSTSLTISQNQFSGSAIASPVIIQVVPVAVNKTVELSKTKAAGSVSRNRKNYRKIVPKIQIDRY